MSQNPPQPNPTGPGGPPQSGQPSQQAQPPYGYPPHPGRPLNYPPGYAPQGGQPQSYPPGYPQSGQPGLPQAYPQPGRHGAPPNWAGTGAYGPPPPGSYQPGRPPVKKSPGLIIGIVAAAMVLLVAVGGIFIALSGDRGDQPSSTITPEPPTSQPSRSTSQPSRSTSQPSNPSAVPTQPAQPTGDAIDLGNGIGLTPAAGWNVQDRATGVASLTNGQGVFYARQAELDRGTNAVQYCDAFNQAALKSASNADFGKSEATDVGSDKLSAATCGAAYTQTSGDQSIQVLVSSLVSVRKSDGLTVVGTLLFVKSTDAQTRTDAGAMISSMLNSQVS